MALWLAAPMLAHFESTKEDSISLYSLHFISLKFLLEIKYFLTTVVVVLGSLASNFIVNHIWKHVLPIS